jgi:dTDP-4-dehydrorhamnose 3,5-epimerase
MRFLDTIFRDAFLIELEPATDSRGHFARAFCEREFAERGLETRFVQHSRSFSTTAGTLRGMHYQTAPHAEVKVIGCLAGTIYDVIVDLRAGSKTYGRWQGFELSAANQRHLYVPAGFAHGFQTLTNDVLVNYLISAFYEQSASMGLRYDDPALRIRWPQPISVISNKDRSWPLLDSLAAGVLCG